MSLDEENATPTPDISKDFVKYLKEGGSYDLAVSAWATAHMVPIPPSIIKRVRLGFGRLIDGSFDYVANSIKRRNAKLDFNSKIQQDVVSTLAKKGKTELSNAEPDLTSDVARSFLNEHGLKLTNRTSIVQAAFEELRDHPPLFDATPDADPNHDWLNRFAEIASIKSDPDMQRLMGKILAGEIRKPGSFSLLSVHILSTLSHDVAQEFEKLCSVSFRLHDVGQYISLDVFPSFRSEGIPEIEFNYYDLQTLRSYQLISTEGDSGFQIKVGAEFPFKTANEEFLLIPNIADPQTLVTSIKRFNIISFTPMGVELGKLISAPPPEWLNQKIKDTFKSPQWSLLRPNK